jgi:hypothetical protein
VKPSLDRAQVLLRLVERPPLKKQSEAAQVVDEHRRLIRRAMRRGHSLTTLARELNVPKRALQKELNIAGLFFRKPRKNRGVVVRPYKRRKNGR